MTNFNGAIHHNVEDILANIRSSIADETGSLRAQARPVFPNPAQRLDTAQADQRREPMLSDEAAEFELPAIFKPGYQPAPEKPNLLGRLSEALKSQQSQPTPAAAAPAPTPAPEPDRSRTVIRFEPAGARTVEPQQPRAVVERFEPRMSANTESEEDIAKRVAAENASCKREMASFKDSRMSGMSAMSSKPYVPSSDAAPAPYVPPATEPVAVQAPVYIPAPAPQPRAPMFGPIFTPAVQAPPVQAPPPRNEAPQYPVLNSRPPALPDNSLMGGAGGAVEDAAAQMLRPILRQWLTDNMPKIVEKALRSEAGSDMDPHQSQPYPHQQQQQPLPPVPEVRKTLR